MRAWARTLPESSKIYILAKKRGHDKFAYLRVTCAVKVTGVPSGMFRQRLLENSYLTSGFHKIVVKKYFQTFSSQSFCRCSRWCNELKLRMWNCLQSWCLLWSSGTLPSPIIHNKRWKEEEGMSTNANTSSTTLLESEEICPATLVEIIWVRWYDIGRV